jgi:hypothetical protein
MMPGQFTTRQLFWCVTLIAAGIGSCSNCVRVFEATSSAWLGLAAWLGGWGMMGAGCGVLSRHAIVWALLGVLCGVALSPAFVGLFLQFAR